MAQRPRTVTELTAELFRSAALTGRQRQFAMAEILAYLYKLMHGRRGRPAPREG